MNFWPILSHKSHCVDVAGRVPDDRHISQLPAISLPPSLSLSRLLGQPWIWARIRRSILQSQRTRGLNMKTRVRVHLPIWRLPAKSNKTNDNPPVNRQQATVDRRNWQLATRERRAKTKTKAQGAINNSKTLYNDSNKEHDDDLAHPIHQHRWDATKAAKKQSLTKESKRKMGNPTQCPSDYWLNSFWMFCLRFASDNMLHMAEAALASAVWLPLDDAHSAECNMSSTRRLKII